MKYELWTGDFGDNGKALAQQIEDAAHKADLCTMADLKPGAHLFGEPLLAMFYNLFVFPTRSQDIDDMHKAYHELDVDHFLMVDGVPYNAWVLTAEPVAVAE